jgi:hypothetical protein
VPVTRADIEAARGRVAGGVRRTPLWKLAGRELGLDCREVWLKLEHVQIGGSFKARGMRLRPARRRRRRRHARRRDRLAVEPAAALPLAALHSGIYLPDPLRRQPRSSHPHLIRPCVRLVCRAGFCRPRHAARTFRRRETLASPSD